MTTKLRKVLTLSAAAFILSAPEADAQRILAPILYTHHNAAAAGYSGPGDVKTFAVWWGTYAYSAAKRGTKALNVCNVSDVACADVNSDATTGLVPDPTIGGVLCGTTVGVNVCTIKTWYDQTGNGFDEVQATIANRATFVPSCSGLTGAVCGTASSTAAYATASNFTQTQGFSVAWVAKHNSATGTIDDVIGGRDASTPLDFGSTTVANQIQINAGASTPATASDAAWHGVSGSINNGVITANVTVDATNSAPGGGGSHDFSGGFPLEFLTNYSSSSPWKGQVASGGVAAGTFNTTEQAAVNAASKTILGY
jgi:hypothetical protein